MRKLVHELPIRVRGRDHFENFVKDLHLSFGVSRRRLKGKKEGRSQTIDLNNHFLVEYGNLFFAHLFAVLYPWF